MNNLMIYIFIFILCISSILISIIYFINQQSSSLPKVSPTLISTTQPPKVSSTQPSKVSSTEPPKVSSTEPPKVSIMEQGTFVGELKENVMCTMDFNPVKCPDGKIYSNSCGARIAGWINCVRINR